MMFADHVPFAGEEHRAFTIGQSDRVVLCIHGFPGTPAEFRQLASGLVDLGWAVDALLLPGFGPEITQLRAQHHKAWLQAVSERLQFLQSKYRQVVLIGNSMGAALSIQSAANIRVDALILLAPFYRINHFLWDALPVIRRVFPTIKPFRFIKLNFSDPAAREGILNFMPGVDLDDLATQEQIRRLEIPLHIFDQIRIIGKQGWRAAVNINCPTLVIQGTQDELVHPQTTRDLIEQFHQPPTYIEVEAKHDLLTDNHPAMQQIIRDFLSKL